MYRPHSGGSNRVHLRAPVHPDRARPLESCAGRRLRVRGPVWGGGLSYAGQHSSSPIESPPASTDGSSGWGILHTWAWQPGTGISPSASERSPRDHCMHRRAPPMAHAALHRRYGSSLQPSYAPARVADASRLSYCAGSSVANRRNRRLCFVQSARRSSPKHKKRRLFVGVHYALYHDGRPGAIGPSN